MDNCGPTHRSRKSIMVLVVTVSKVVIPITNSGSEAPLDIQATDETFYMDHLGYHKDEFELIRYY